ncbi:MAG: hypothetical protein JXJ19_07190 [Elusimicrobia bacterium]|nr:hypothetical protein [Elusimicrobiota bacterium]
MKKMIATLFSVLVIAVCEGIAGDFSLTGDYAIYSSYVWRGFELDGDPVIQTGLGAGYKVFSIYIWNSQDTSCDDDLDSAEVDLTLDVTKAYGPLSVSAGNTFYTFPAGDARSREAYISFSYDTVLSPAISAYLDYGDEEGGGGDGGYLTVAVAHSIVLADHFPVLELDGSIGINNGLFIEGNGGDVRIGASVPFELGPGIMIDPSINCVLPSGDMAEEDDGGQDPSFYAGFSLGYGI